MRMTRVYKALLEATTALSLGELKERTRITRWRFSTSKKALRNLVDDGRVLQTFNVERRKTLYRMASMV